MRHMTEVDILVQAHNRDIRELKAEYNGLLADYHKEIDKRHDVQALLKDREAVLMANKETIAELQAENEALKQTFVAMINYFACHDDVVEFIDGLEILG